MIATNEAADVLRHGWQDAASSLAGDVPEVADLLQARLEVAISSRRLDEKHLLETIEEVESITSRAGSRSGDALARRLRRTVYEYLLALDAARPLETTAVVVDARPAPEGPMVGAEEIAALGHAANAPVAPPEVVEAPPLDGGDAEPEEEAIAEGRSAKRRFGLRRRPGRDDEAADEVAVADDDHPADLPPPTPDEEPAAPDWHFTAPPFEAEGDPAVTATEPVLEPTAAPGAAEGAGLEPPAGDAPGDLLPVGAEDGGGPTGTGAVDVAVDDGTAAGHAEEPPGDGDQPAGSFVAPRVGFHIVDDEPSSLREHDVDPLPHAPVRERPGR